jgi:hypothetical protein
LDASKVCILFAVVLLVLATVLASPAVAIAQEAGASLDAQLLDQNTDRLAINRTGMQVLLGWSALNLGAGTWGYFASEGRWKYFHQMNAGWNIVNGAIAVGSLIGAASEDPASPGLVATLQEANFIEKVLLFNAGLDVGYIATGAFLNERGLRKDSDRLVGYGRSLMLQGAFLLAFDGVLFWLHQQNTSDFVMSVEPLVGQVTGAALHISF